MLGARATASFLTPAPPPILQDYYRAISAGKYALAVLEKWGDGEPPLPHLQFWTLSRLGEAYAAAAAASAGGGASDAGRRLRESAVRELELAVQAGAEFCSKLPGEKQAVKSIQEGLASVRRLLAELRPAGAGLAGPAAAVRAASRQHSSSGEELPPFLSSDDDPPPLVDGDSSSSDGGGGGSADEPPRSSPPARAPARRAPRAAAPSAAAAPAPRAAAAASAPAIKAGFLKPASPAAPAPPRLGPGLAAAAAAPAPALQPGFLNPSRAVAGAARGGNPAGGQQADDVQCWASGESPMFTGSVVAQRFSRSRVPGVSYTHISGTDRIAVKGVSDANRGAVDAELRAVMPAVLPMLNAGASAAGDRSSGGAMEAKRDAAPAAPPAASPAPRPRVARPPTRVVLQSQTPKALAAMFKRCATRSVPVQNSSPEQKQRLADELYAKLNELHGLDGASGSPASTWRLDPSDIVQVSVSYNKFVERIHIVFRREQPADAALRVTELPSPDPQAGNVAVSWEPVQGKKGSKGAAPSDEAAHLAAAAAAAAAAAEADAAAVAAAAAETAAAAEAAALDAAELAAEEAAALARRDDGRDVGELSIPELLSTIDGYSMRHVANNRKAVMPGPSADQAGGAAPESDDSEADEDEDEEDEEDDYFGGRAAAAEFEESTDSVPDAARGGAADAEATSHGLAGKRGARTQAPGNKALLKGFRFEDLPWEVVGSEKFIRVRSMWAGGLGLLSCASAPLLTAGRGPTRASSVPHPPPFPPPRPPPPPFPSPSG